MNGTIDAFWMTVGIVTATLSCFGLLLLAFAGRLRHIATELAACIRQSPLRASLAVAALGVLVSYAGTKPPATTYTVAFSLPLAMNPIDNMQCEPGKVYNLPVVPGYRWMSSVADRLYDGGMLVFDLADPGEIVTMTAVGE